ncbi:MAG TPA: trypsin-like peptidase domain-containing protein [Acidimicrobiales bacterium]|nr:trypsin-like peptidase domain-containing protein [Acidimicrobiales bacterium]
MRDSDWNIDPGVSPPTRDDAWYPTAGRPSPWGDPPGAPPPAAPPFPASTPVPSPPSLQHRGGPGRLVGSLAIGVVLALCIGFFAGRATSSHAPSAAVADALANAQVTPAGTKSTPLTGKEPEPVAAVAKALSPAAVQLQGSQDLGSGFIYDSSGLILTAAHVVSGNDTMTVRLNDGTQVKGTVVGSDAATDVAVVRIDVGHKLPVAQLALDEPVEVGQMAIALGSPYGLTQSVTSGIVSAVNRTVPTAPNNTVALIQTDAPINPGNSGGMLANRHGQVIGVNDSIITGSSSGGEAGNVGVGFAIPIDLAKSVADKLVAGKPIEFGFLGVQTKNADGSRVGGLIAEVEAGSPASEAGLQTGDVVVKVDDSPVASGTDLAAAIRARKPGDKVKLSLFRDGNEQQVTVTLGQSPG